MGTVTTVTTTERVKEKKVGRRGGSGPKGPNGHRGHGGGGDKRGSNDDSQKFSPEKYRIAMWAGIFSIAMLFGALVVAYISLAYSSDHWRSIQMPPMLWLSTALILAGSATIEKSRKALRNGSGQDHRLWLRWTLMLGLGFLVSQLLAWRALVRQQLYLSSNQHAAFFYFLTGIHAVHLIGGLLAVSYLTLRTWRQQADQRALVKREATTGAVALYWHFMDGLWVFLFVILFIWR